ncbi:MAG: DUF421 domain-containing protein [Oscillospiraceae bacterium]|nr:DUF421 domain-containing protein [Oscillospiraceae bacterium]
MSIFMIRTLILYLIVVFSMRLMGKRQIGELQPSELVVAIMISDLAAVPMQAIDIPLLSGVIPVLTLIVAEIFMSFLSMKSSLARKILTGEPSIIIYKGHINEHEMRKLRFDINDLLEELRMNNYPDISEIAYAVLETNGEISIIPKNDAKNITVGDLKNGIGPENFPCMLISDGILNREELDRSGKTEKWLMRELRKFRVYDIKDVFICSFSDNKLFVQKKGENDVKK